MNRNHLALFDAVARHGNITRASAELRISQPAVSKQIAELERSLGVRLIDRLPRGCRLTEAGTILADYARRWRGLEDEAERAIGDRSGGSDGDCGSDARVHGADRALDLRGHRACAVVSRPITTRLPALPALPASPALAARSG